MIFWLLQKKFGHPCPSSYSWNVISDKWRDDHSRPSLNHLILKNCVYKHCKKVFPVYRESLSPDDIAKSHLELTLLLQCKLERQFWRKWGLRPQLLILAIGWCTLWVGCPAIIVHPVIKEIEKSIFFITWDRSVTWLCHCLLFSCCAPVCSNIFVMAEQNLM